MKNKLFTLTVTLIALMGLTMAVAAQSKLAKYKEVEAVERATVKKPMLPPDKPAPASAVLKCEANNKEFNEKIFVTNTTGATLPAGHTIKYSIVNKQGSFKLTAALPANATLTQSSFPYAGYQPCKAWY